MLESSREGVLSVLHACIVTDFWSGVKSLLCDFLNHSGAAFVADIAQSFARPIRAKCLALGKGASEVDTVSHQASVRMNGLNLVSG